MVWIIQRKIQRGDWETIASFFGQRKDALSRYEYLVNDTSNKLRAVSEKQAQSDYLAGRADNFKNKVQTTMFNTKESLSTQEFAVRFPELRDLDFVAEQQTLADQQYQSYLTERNITEEDHLVEVMHWCDSQD